MKNKITEKKIAEETESKRKKELAEEIKKDFESRKEARRSIEQGWRINMNFVSGNQYCFVSHAGNLETEDAEFYWQSRRCFNHIAPTVETRIARLSKVRPVLNSSSSARRSRRSRGAPLSARQVRADCAASWRVYWVN